MTNPSRFLRDNGLSLAFLALFAVSLVGMSVAGLGDHNQEQARHGERPISYGEYLAEAHFWEAVTENWESEFLQMGFYVVLTAFLFQRGSSESKDPDKKEAVDADPFQSRRLDAPWPVRRKGWPLKIYQCSLSLAFLGLFLASFGGHALSGYREQSAERLAHGLPEISLFEYASGATFWFESLQNWQSEFLAVLSMVTLSIFLRQRGSPESKPVDFPHHETGRG
ncbi:MAG TPA: DUF6766 family protein [Haliangium sp.]|nr:DUF6766 family protein [Haliangium sp.]